LNIPIWYETQADDSISELFFDSVARRYRFFYAVLGAMARYTFVRACGETPVRWADIAKAAFVLAAMLAGVQGGFYVADATGWPPGLTVAPLMVAALLLAIRVVRGKA
jgi:hypothetical protein